jgi:death on curing protein
VKEPRWISKQAVVAIHERLLAEHGGMAGLIDEGRPDAALASPRNHLLYEDVDLFTMAAAYAYALTRSHPFHDGNKRIALTAAGVFLELNGYRLQATEQEAVAATSAVSSGRMDLKGYAVWLQTSSVRLPKARAASRAARAKRRRP